MAAAAVGAVVVALGSILLFFFNQARIGKRTTRANVFFLFLLFFFNPCTHTPLTRYAGASEADSRNPKTDKQNTDTERERLESEMGKGDAMIGSEPQKRSG